MGRLVVTNNVSLDGVMQAPGRPDEDTRDGFRRGGWASRYSDDTLVSAMGEGMAKTEVMLFGRRTYQDFAGFWPKQPPNRFTDYLNGATKYVVSRTVTEPLPWQNSSLLGGDAMQAVADLKQRTSGDIALLGSGELIQSLRENDLIDEYLLLIHPLVLGSGRRLFPDGAVPADLELVDSAVTPKGVMIGRYRPE